MLIEHYSAEEIKNYDSLLSEIGEFSPEFFKENIASLMSWKDGVIKSLRNNFTKELSSHHKAYDGITDVLFDKKDYYTLMELVVRKVPGQSIGYSAMLDEMEKLSAYMNSIQESTITPYRDLVANLLEKPQNLNTISPSIPSTIEIDMESKSMVNAQISMRTIFANSEVNTSGKYGELFTSNNDYIKCSGRVKALSATLNKIDTKKILKDITTISDICEVLIRRCKDTSNNNYIISDAMSTMLYDVTIFVAKKIDTFSMYRYRMDSITNTFIENDKIIGR